MPDNKLPKQVVDQWPEILGDIEVDVLPLEYLHTIRVQFLNGKIWEIDIDKSKKTNDYPVLEELIEGIFEEYDEQIDSVDFRLDTTRIKSDIKKRTHQFMKKRR